MGIDPESARFLSQASKAGVVFDRTVTLGHQNLYISDREWRDIVGPSALASGRSVRSGSADPLGAGGQRFADAFFEALGAKHLDSIDFSDFESASIVHDMNRPIPEAMVEQYDAVVDVGTLEHVFNFPQSIGNCMRMAKVGGRLFLHTPANNYFGHGFYQFSPELLFRVLSSPNGYEVERMVLAEYGPRRRWYDVADPDDIDERVTLVNPYPVLLLVQAVKTDVAPRAVETPQQSDYKVRWDESATGDAGSPGTAQARLTERLKHTLLNRWPRTGRAIESLTLSSLNPSGSLRNRRAFRRITK